MIFRRAVGGTIRAALAAAALAGCASSGGQVQRIAVISAFHGELEVLLAQVENPRAPVFRCLPSEKSVAAGGASSVRRHGFETAAQS